MAHSANNSALFNPKQFPEDQHFLIAYSGGADSTALLHFCAHHPELKHRIRAIHINHQLQSSADDWQQHCEHQCQLWHIPCVVECVTLSDDTENTARQARRQAFAQHLKSNETLLTGHHQQDQVETVLFRLFRGTGLKGLGGMQSESTLPDGQAIQRPMLSLSKKQITDYLNTHQLTWVEDPSNQSDRYSRNHIRNQILPEVQRYSEHAFDAIFDTAHHLQNSQDLLMRLIPADNPLVFNEQMDATYLHHWLHKRCISPPKHKQLSAFLISCHQAESHKHPTLDWGEQRLMMWRGQIYLLSSISDTGDFTTAVQKQMSLPCGGHLCLSERLPGMDQITIRYAVTGAQMKLSHHIHHKSIKKLHQERKTPPWDKAVTPFVYHNNELLAVGDWTSETFDQLLQTNNCQYSWQKPEQIL